MWIYNNNEDTPNRPTHTLYCGSVEASWEAV